VNGDPLITGVDSVYPNQNFSSVRTSWEKDTRMAAMDFGICDTLDMLSLRYVATDSPFLPGGFANPCRNQFPSGLRVQCEREDGLTGTSLGNAGVGITSSGRFGGIFVGGNAQLGLEGDGVVGVTTADSNNLAGVRGQANGFAFGVKGRSAAGTGVEGESFSSDITGARSGPGVRGIGPLVTAPRSSPPGGPRGTSWPGVLGIPASANPRGNGVEGRSPLG
jgi:hypothetical protein